jgi:hypothetical protein
MKRWNLKFKISKHKFIPQYLQDQNASGSKTTEQTEDIADSLESACHQMKQQHAKRSGILRQLDTQARCTLFFVSPDITPDNVNSLAEQMVKFCQEEPHCRFLAKVELLIFYIFYSIIIKGLSN